MENKEEKKPFDLRGESKEFAIRSIKLYQYLTEKLTILSASVLLLSLSSCSKADFNDIDEGESKQPVEVSVSLSSIDFTLNPATVPKAFASGQTRASDATPTEAGITRIALKVFNEDGEAVADTCQIASAVGEGFNKLGVQLLAGNYTFVAVAHDASADNVGCATIESLNSATLPEGVVPTLYCCVKEVEIKNANKQMVSIEMGTRVNATLHIASSDIVPDEVSKVTVNVNPSGVAVSNGSPVKFNPASGLAIGNRCFKRALPVTPGQVINVSANILILEEPYKCQMEMGAMDAGNQLLVDYARSFENVPFQRAYVTNASGQFFRYVNTSSMTFDTTSGTLDFSF